MFLFSAKIQDGRQKWRKLKFFPFYLFLFNRALKLCWIKRLVEGSGNWQKLFEAMLGLNEKHLWQLDQ